jgi:phosphoglycolate phosphatase-like HAD superfamily hydrolase
VNSTAPPLLLFDIDGTLVHVAEELAFASAFFEHCGAAVDLSFAADMVISDAGYARGVLRRAGLPHEDTHVDAALARFVDHLRAAIDAAQLTVRPVAGAPAFVSALHGTPIGVATGCVEGSARVKLAAVGLQTTFPVGGFSQREQSRAEILERAIAAAARHYRREFGRGTTVYFGDGTWDIVAARAAGIGFIGINEHERGRERLRAAGAPHVFADYTDTAAIDAAVRALLRSGDLNHR